LANWNNSKDRPAYTLGWGATLG